MQCLCENDELNNFNQYIDDDDETLIGVICLSCDQEWLTEEYLNQRGENRIIFNGQSLTEQKNPLEKEQEQFQVKSSRTIIEADNCHILKPGDHISWHRPYIIWHHAIVDKIDMENKRIEVICYNKVENTEHTKNKYKVVTQSTSCEEEWGKLYRIDYPKEVTDKNPTKLTLSRARSKLGETKYGFLSNNCESFAAFCKTGVSDSCQVRWLWGKIKEACGTAVGQLAEGVSKAVFAGSKMAYNATVLKSAGNLTASEMIEHAINASNKVGAGIVILIESGYLIWDLTKIYEKERSGDISHKDFLESCFQRFSEALVAAGLAIAGSLVGEALGGTVGAAIGTAVMPVIGTAVGASVGAFVGSVILGALGAIGGKLLGSLASPGIAKSIDHIITRDNRAVKDINELQQGDHVLFYRNLLHHNHHAIVVYIDSSKNKVRVIHNTYTKGVIEEWVDSETPLYRVIYKNDSSHHAESVIERAKSKLGRNVYNFFFYNCKDFANWCKELNTNNVSLVSKSKL